MTTCRIYNSHTKYPANNFNDRRIKDFNIKPETLNKIKKNMRNILEFICTEKNIF